MVKMSELKWRKEQWLLGTVAANIKKGMKVYDNEGELVGKVKDLEVSTIAKKPIALIVHRGFFRHDVQILADYIQEVEGDRVKLNIASVAKLEGRKVYDSEGVFIGKVIEVRRVGETNVLDSIVVRTKILMTRDRGAYEDEHPIPGEKKPASFLRGGLETPYSVPSGEIEIEMPEARVETIKEDITIQSKNIESLGRDIRLGKTKEEILGELE